MLQQRTPRAASQMRSRIVLEVRFRRGERPQQQWTRVVRVKFMRERTTAMMSFCLLVQFLCRLRRVYGETGEDLRLGTPMVACSFVDEGGK